MDAIRLHTLCGSALALAFALAFGSGCTGMISRSDSDATNSATGIGGASGASGSGGALADASVAADRPLMRRLTRAQYHNTIRDLLGTIDDPASAFAEDEAQAGYAVNSTLPAQDLQLQQYQDAAETLSASALSTRFSEIVGCAPTGAAEAPCIDTFVQSFGKRAYRRPLVEEEVARYIALFNASRRLGDFRSAVASVLQAMLQSPHFLYRVELGTPGPTPEADGALPLTSYEVASRLSYFIWSSMPDAELLAAASSNQLGTVEQVSVEARKMLADPKARDALVSFHEQWLGLGALDTLDKTDPTFTPELRTAMHQEFDDFTDFVVRGGDGRLQTLLGGDFSFLQGPLFALYGVAKPAGSGQQTLQASFPSGQRSGLLTSAAVMATHAHSDQTSIVHRGKMIREQLLCTPLPPPPPNVDTSPPPVDPNVSARKRFEQHTQSPSCAACHRQMDPLGDTFESYDALGRYRTMDGKQPIDATGVLSGSASHDGNVVNAVDMLQKLAVDETVRRCVAAQWFRFAFGRVEDDTDRATIAAAFQAFSSGDYRISDLIVALTTTRTFRYRRPVLSK